MRTITVTSVAILALSTIQAVCQTSQPLYQVTIVSRTTKALNYGYLSAPTRIDFKGTALMSSAHGESVVEPGRGATLLKMRFEDLARPSQFGAQYLTYVVWAISPDGRAQNLGELAIDASGKAKLNTSTPLQTFAMIVTAEPYYSVTQPSDAVVMENRVGRGTIGNVQEVNATYELLPRKSFTYEAGKQPAATAGTMVSEDQYEAVNALYQALNAIQIAQSQEADKYAPERLARARDIYNKARAYPAHLTKEIVSMAREAAQIAEDSRAIAVKRSQAEKDAEEQTKSRTTEPPPPTPPPQASVRPAPAPQSIAPPVAPASAQQATPAESGAPSIEVDHRQFYRRDPNASENRRRILTALAKSYEVVDSTRGLVVTIFDGSSNLAPISSAIRPYAHNLHLEVQGHSATPNAAATERDAERAKQMLIAAGVPAELISARGYGNAHPRTSNATATGRRQNERVEIVIAGDAIGTLPTWDRTYSLRPTR